MKKLWAAFLVPVMLLSVMGYAGATNQTDNATSPTGGVKFVTADYNSARYIGVFDSERTELEKDGVAYLLCGANNDENTSDDIVHLDDCPGQEEFPEHWDDSTCTSNNGAQTFPTAFTVTLPKGSVGADPDVVPTWTMSMVWSGPAEFGDGVDTTEGVTETVIFLNTATETAEVYENSGQMAVYSVTSDNYRAWLLHADYVNAYFLISGKDTRVFWTDEAISVSRTPITAVAELKGYQISFNKTGWTASKSGSATIRYIAGRNNGAYVNGIWRGGFYDGLDGYTVPMFFVVNVFNLSPVGGEGLKPIPLGKTSLGGDSRGFVPF